MPCHARIHARIHARMPCYDLALLVDEGDEELVDGILALPKDISHDLRAVYQAGLSRRRKGNGEGRGKARGRCEDWYESDRRPGHSLSQL